MLLEKRDLIHYTLTYKVIGDPAFGILKFVETTSEEPLKYTPQIDERADAYAVSRKANRSMKFCAVVLFKDLSVAATFIIGDVSQRGILSYFLNYKIFGAEEESYLVACV